MLETNKINYLFAGLLGIAGLLVILIFTNLSSQADTDAGTASTTISNTAPVIDLLTLADGGGGRYATQAYTTLEAPADANSPRTSDVTVTVDYTDDNTCDEVETDGSFIVKLYKESIGTGACVEGNLDSYQCYEDTVLTTGDYSCSDACTGTGDAVGQIVCTIPVSHYADPGTWVVEATVTDGSGLTDTASSSFTVNAVTAIGLIDTTLNFGTLALGATSTAGAVSASVRNTGNVDAALSIYGDDMTCSESGTIPIENIKLATTSIAYEALPYAVGTSTQNTTDLLTTLTRQSSNTVTENTHKDTFYGGILIPSTLVAGSCTTTITVIGS